jgi:hypothetical protein
MERHQTYREINDQSEIALFSGEPDQFEKAVSHKEGMLDQRDEISDHSFDSLDGRTARPRSQTSLDRFRP